MAVLRNAGSAATIIGTGYTSTASSTSATATAAVVATVAATITAALAATLAVSSGFCGVCQ
jgi:hypothetical protein